jgi:protein O-mannosyl-transferase
MFVKRNWTFLFFVILVLLLYFPLINKSFASDDFAVLRRVVFFENGIFIKDFFRPLSDITLYSNYLVAGFNPVVYNLFNFLSHACIVWMVFLIARRVHWVPANMKKPFSWLAALLFLTFPSHNESVVWGVGRASLMAALFGVLALLVAVWDMPRRRKYLLACLCYFIGLSGYESILVVPAIVVVLLYRRGESWRTYTGWAAWFSITLVVHIIVRVWVSGVLVGDYGANTMTRTNTSLLEKYAKVAGRLFLPPTDNGALLIWLFVGVVMIMAGGYYLLWRKRKQDGGDAFLNVLRLSLLLFLSLIIPFAFGVSTRTWEGDRLLYFPSVLFALWLAYLLLTALQRKQAYVLATIVIGYQLVFLMINIFNWHKASVITTQIIDVVSNAASEKKKIAVINIPEEYEGMHVFRNGFYDALWLKGVDTSVIKAVNYVTTSEMRLQPATLTPSRKDGETMIAPATHIIYGRDLLVRNEGTEYIVQADTMSVTIFYWNKEQLVKLE